MSHVFEKLAPFVQEFIYNKGWNSLKEIQGKAIEAILDTDQHLLISAGTATGKTEAAFFPIVSLLSQGQYHSVSVLYISPLKALINDQFERLNDLLSEADIPVCKWHGDVSAVQKKRLLERPRGVLQITPESLEAMLMRRSSDLMTLFGQLQFVVIDEVHAMMGEDRGGQLLCQLTKLERFTGCKPRRVGLSATLGDCEEAAMWLAQGTTRETAILQDQSRRTIRLAVNWFKKERGQNKEKEQAEDNAYYESIYKKCIQGKTIIFTNSRGEAEEVISQMRELALMKGEADIFHVHHGNISKLLREEAEQAMKNQERLSVVAATLTLELGIDIGVLEQVMQVGAPYTCSSFMQRLGRSGRRTGISKMYFTNQEEVNAKGETIEELPWELLRIIAVIELSVREKWIEPINHKQLSFSLLYHQTMSMLVSKGEMSAVELARSVLTLPMFKEVTQEDYKALLRHLIDIEHLQKTEENTFIIGLKAEHLVNHYSFYSVFKDEEEFKVNFDGRTIGTINSLPPLGINIALAGKAWQVVETDLEGKIVWVKPIKKSTQKLWIGERGEVHTKIVQRMKQVLMEETDYPYLLPSAKERLQEARALAHKIAILKRSISQIGENSYLILPWLGTKEMKALGMILKSGEVKRALQISKISVVNEYAIMVYSTLAQQEFLQLFIREINEVEKIDDQVIRESMNNHNKFDEYVHMELLRKQYMSEYIDIEGIRRMMSK